MLDEAPPRRAAMAPPEPEDAPQLAAGVRGERDALAALYDRHGARLLAAAVALVKDQAVAESLLHDAFLLAWHQARQFDAARSSVAGWLMTRLLEGLRAACSQQQRAQAAQALRAMMGQTGGRP